MLDYLQIKKDKYSMELDERVQELEIEVEDLQSEIDRLFASQGTTDEQIVDLSNQITTIRADIDEMKARIDECDTQIDDIKQEHIRDIAALEEKVMEINSVLKDYETLINNNQSDITKLKSDVETNTNQIVELTKDLSSKQFYSNLHQIDILHEVGGIGHFNTIYTGYDVNVKYVFLGIKYTITKKQMNEWDKDFYVYPLNIKLFGKNDYNVVLNGSFVSIQELSSTDEGTTFYAQFSCVLEDYVVKSLFSYEEYNSKDFRINEILSNKHWLNLCLIKKG